MKVGEGTDELAQSIRSSACHCDLGDYNAMESPVLTHLSNT